MVIVRVVEREPLWLSGSDVHPGVELKDIVLLKDVGKLAPRRSPAAVVAGCAASAPSVTVLDYFGCLRLGFLRLYRRDSLDGIPTEEEKDLLRGKMAILPLSAAWLRTK